MPNGKFQSDSRADGTIMTVLGPVEAATLGPTLVHEHLLGDLTPPGRFAPGTQRVAITLENVWDVRYQWCGHYGNQVLDDRELMAAELNILGQDGGRCLVEQTSRGLKPDPAGLAALSRRSGVAVVAGTGFYTVEYAGEQLAGLSRAAIGAQLHGDLTRGMGDTGIRAGFIGEMGLSTPAHPDEIKALAAAARTQADTGAGLCIHPPRDPAAPRRLLDLVKANGGMVEKTAVAHLERTLPAAADFLELARTGCFLELDFFGLESGFYPFAAVDMPNDAGRLAIIRALIDHGHGGQVLVSQDICHLARLRRYGGEGYGHILRNVVPMMRTRGFTADEIDALLVHNPRRFLAVD
jgi:phosphotriesterase-related protein